MKLEDQVINFEFAKKLKELGIKQDSLWYWKGDHKHDMRLINSSSSVDILGHTWKYHCSAFTVAELGKFLIESLSGNKLIFDIIPCWDDGENYWWFTHFINSDQAVIEELGNGNEAEARAKVLIYLLENKVIVLDSER